MPNNETLGASFSIDVTELKAGLAQANRLIRESESEFKAAAAGMDDWRKSEEGLEARIKHLNKACELQQQKVDALQSEYDRLIADGLDPTSAAAVKLRTDINKEKEALAKNQKELEKQTQALEDLADAADDADDALEDVGDAAEDAGDGFTVAKGAMAGFIANGLSALVGAAKNAISSLIGLADSTREYRNEMAKLETSFQTADLSADAANKTFLELYGIMGDEGAATEAAQHLAKISKDEEDLAANTRILAGVMAEYGNSIPTEGLAEGMAATAAMGSVQGVLADALEWQGVNLDKFNEQLAKLSTEEERAAFIQTTLTDLYGESADAYMENNAAVIEANKAQAEYNQKQAELGEKMQPIATAILNIKSAALDVVSWALDNMPIVATVVGGVTAAIVAHKVATLAATAASKGMTLAQYAMTTAQTALNAAMNANPIGLIVLGITALVAAFMYLWKNCDAFRQFWIDLWDGIKNAFSAVVNWIKENWDTMLLALVNPLGAVFKYCYEHFEGFRNFVDNIVISVKQFFANMWQGLTDGAKSAWQGVKDTFSAVASFFGDTFRNAWEGVKAVFSTGGKIFDGIKEGIVTAFKTVVNAIITGINKVVKLPFQGLNNILDTLSGLSIAGVNPFSWLTWRAPIPQLPMLEKGGVVRKATTAVIGENGAEAVMPLEKNTGWIKKLAAEIAVQQPQGVVVNQTNNYSQAHSRVELYKTKQATAAAVRLAMAGA